MSDNKLKDVSVIPDETVLKNTLSKSYSAYTKMLEVFKKHELMYEWIHYKDGGWLCKVQNKKKKTIVWAAAYEGYMKATIYIPEKYTPGLYELDIFEETKDFIKNTKNVGKSKPCIFDIKNAGALKDFEKIISYKKILK